MQAMGPTILEGSQFGLRDMILAAIVICLATRLDTRLPQSRAGGKGPYFRSPEHLGWSGEGIKKNN